MEGAHHWRQNGLPKMGGIFKQFGGQLSENGLFILKYSTLQFYNYVLEHKWMATFAAWAAISK